MTVLKLLLYFLAGAGEWSLATFRGWYIAKGKAGRVAIIVFIEELFMVGGTAYVVNNPDEWFLLLSGALGGAIGSYFSLRRAGGKRGKNYPDA
jgi:O-antigen/teichoic acid export membrane protein